jgi:hypothetical protein
MKITAVDTQKNLFVVEDFYPAELLDRFLATDHLLTAHKKEAMQNDWPRRRLVKEPDSIYELFDNYVKSRTEEIGKIIGISLMGSDTGFWLDEPGFCMNSHVDIVQVAMQVYLNHNDPLLGTVFYNPDCSVRHKPNYKINTGYIMINNPNQFHGMGVPVPKDTYRISSYSWLHPKV